jgi:PAS domain S-box-containing protein
MKRNHSMNGPPTINRNALATHLTLAAMVLVITVVAILERHPPIFIAYAFPILVASFVLSPASSFLYAGLTTVGYAIVFLSGAVTTPFDFVRVMLLFFIAGVAFLLSSQFAHTVQEKDQSEADYRNLFERVPVGLYRTMPDGRILEANPALAEIFGYASPQDMLEVNAADLYATPHGHTEWMKQFSESEGQLSVETLFKRKDGSVFWATDVTRAVYDHTGRLKYYEGSLIDISQRKKAEQELQEQQRSMSALLRNMPGMAYRCVNDTDWTTDFVSEGCFELTGYPPEDLIGNKKIAYKQLIHPQDRQRVWAKVQEAIAHRQPFQLEYRITTANQQEKWVWEQGQSIGTNAQGLAILEGFITDITERKRAEEALRRQTTQLGLLNDIAKQIVATQDTNNILNRTVKLIQDNFGYHHVAIFMFVPATNELEMRARAGQFVELFPREHRLKLGEGMVGWCAQHNKTLLSNDVSSDEHYINFYPDRIPTRSELSIPLHVEGKVIGVLDIQSPRLDAFDQNDIRVMETLADQIAIGLENAKLLTEIRQQVERLNALHLIDQTIASSTNRRLVLNMILEQAMRLFQADAGDFLLFNPIEYTLDFAAGIGFAEPGVPRPRLHLGEGLAGQAALHRKTIILHGDAKTILPAEKFSCYYGVPLIAKGELKGVLEFFFHTHIHHPEWENFLNTLSGQAAIALENMDLFERLQRSNIELSLAYNETIEGWSAALDLRDKETEGHTQRVTEMTLRLAASMGIQDTMLLHIRRGALLHDIGKMGIPDYILLKTEELTAEEAEIMRKHPLYAYELLSKIAYLKPALDIPYCHHERWNGSGYPRGLKGEQIPLAARIFSVVDVWDALTSDRPYRKGWSQKKALSYIRQNAGKLFDPKVVEAFLNLFETT